MKKWTFAITICAMLTCAAQAGLLVGMGANNDVAEARVAMGDPNTGYAGLWVDWGSAFPKDASGFGGFGVIDVTRSAKGLVDDILGPPNSWWELLEVLGGRSYLVAKAGAIDLPSKPAAYAAPGLGIALGPISFEQYYGFVEGGGVPELKGGYKVKSGYDWQLFVQKVFKF